MANNISNPFISVVSPVYGCKTCLYELYIRLKETLEKITDNFEIILVNDDSPDGAWEAIIELTRKDSRVKGLSLSRNFGQHNSIAAGLDNCSGEWIVVMDCDLQDQPEEILNLYEKAREGFHIVFAQRIVRKDRLIKRIYSRIFYSVFGYLTDTIQDPAIANFGIYHRNVIESIRKMGDYHKYFPTMIRWVGYKHTKIPVSHAERDNGQSAYSFKKSMNLAAGIILSFSDKPLKMTVRFGFLISCLASLFAVYNLVLYFENKILVPGYTSLIISVWFLSGLIIMVLGVVGLYIGKTFDKVKGRPSYIIMDKTF
jgi:polyisoprenyl-phosphate glycosyltransferase